MLVFFSIVLLLYLFLNFAYMFLSKMLNGKFVIHFTGTTQTGSSYEFLKNILRQVFFFSFININL